MKKKILILLFLLSVITFGATNQVLLATTTSVRDSGLLDYILPIFKEKTGITVKYVAVGTGKALKMGEDGEVDVLLVHAKTSELKFMKENHGKDRIQFMHNYFVLLGPKNGEKFKNLSDALNKINKNGYKFISRGDDSGTNKKELSLWKSQGITPSKDWYLSSGNGMAATLNIASEKECYTLSDIATYLHLKDKLNLEIKIGNDKNLINEYSVITVNPNKNDMINYKNAKIFM
ncbi:MAG: tungsten ABC transporter substrate-binding protein, partial [Fusobacteria bacterium]